MKSLLLSLFVTLSVIFSSFSQTNTNTLKSSIERGQEIYTDFCISCHLPNGKGVERIYPPLANSDYLIKNREASIKAIKFGMSGDIVVNGKKYNSVMAPLGLSDDEVADVMNYISNSWGNKNEKMVTKAEVSKIKK
ncbi:cytochrome c [Mariniflexile litorale]|uniref:Cytochrome c n=1 Tax=Mariniflexile litorale TaxID=3045158 RepID=A0AAU7EIR4_9FLAO|nr:cytochrome c [Mariniflexile sp. KMM 9835]MDQ8210011.1 cytochrome c [Mariniflexile sp. KMM 9835]